jgi:hypothetical protein
VATLACASPPAQIVVVVDTDLNVPAEVDAIRVEATGPGGELRVARGFVRSGADLPGTVTLVQRGGPRGPIRVRAIAEREGDAIVERSAVVRFVAGEIRVLRLRLDRVCLGVACGAQTCVAGACTDPTIDVLDPYDGVLGRDGGALNDAGPPPDGAVCPLDAVCGHDAEHLPGDTIGVRPCTPSVGFASRVTLPSGLSSDAASVRLTEIGAYEARVSIAAIPGCEVRSSFAVVPFAAVPEVGRPSGALRALSARLGNAFVAGRNGVYAVDGAGWHDLSEGAAGTLITPNLASLVVWNGDVFVGAQTNQGALSRLVVSADLASVEITDVPLPTGRRPTTGMAIALGDVRSDDGPQMIVATQDGFVVVDPSGTTRPIDPPFDAMNDVALGRSEPAQRGAIWGLTRNAIANGALGAAARLAGGAPVMLDSSDARAIVVDDRDTNTPRLWLCTNDVGLRLYDLSGDVSTRTDLGPPLAEAPMACADVALERDGGVWTATSLGVSRIGAGLADRLDLGTPQGLPAEPIDRVALAWDASAREVWALTSGGAVYVARARR